MKWLRFAIIPLLAASMLPAQYAPQPNGEAYDTGVAPDPGHGVARISVLNGEVSVRRGDSGDLVAAAINAPVLSQDRLLTSGESRAEIQFDYSNMLRVGSNSEVRLAGLDNGNYRIQVAIGTVTFRVLRTSNTRADIETPTVAVRPTSVGVYRITVREDGSSEITVRSGEAEIFSQSGSEPLRAGQTMLARGTASDPEFQVVAAIGYDDWDGWNQHRDSDLERSTAYRYVSPSIVGAEDLDSHGRWVNEPSYGNVWVPTVEPGWAPYRNGDWAWEDYYGWTWVSADPWGWAPYHYGRWFYGSPGWCWYPGPAYYHHYWSPALVAFFGFGGYHSGFGFGFGFGNVGWVPLGPREPFYPWWGHGDRWGHGGGYYDRGIVNNINITNVYRNARYNGVTGVESAQFGRHTGRFVGVHGNELGQAGVVRGALPLNPDRSSMQFSNRSVNPDRFPQTGNDRFVGRSGGAGNSSTGNFAQRGSPNGGSGGWRQSPGVAGNSSAGNFSQRPSPNAAAGGWRQSPGASQGASQSGDHGWRRFGEPIHNGQPSGSVTNPQSGRGFGSSVNRQSAPSDRFSSDGGWRRFGGSGAGAAGSQHGLQPQPSNNGGGWNRPQSSAPRYEAPAGGGYRGNNGGGQSSVRISPPIVRNGGASSGYGGGDRGYTAPQGNGGGYRAPQNYGGNSGGGYTAPRNYDRGYTPPQGNGGGYRAPQNYGGNSGGGYRAPQNYGGSTGGGYRAPQSYGGGGYSAPRGNPSGGGGYSAPRTYGGGGSHPTGGGGGGGSHGNGGNGGGRPSGQGDRHR